MGFNSFRESSYDRARQWVEKWNGTHKLPLYTGMFEILFPADLAEKVEKQYINEGLLRTELYPRDEAAIKAKLEAEGQVFEAEERKRTEERQLEKPLLGKGIGPIEYKRTKKGRIVAFQRTKDKNGVIRKHFVSTRGLKG